MKEKNATERMSEINDLMFMIVINRNKISEIGRSKDEWLKAVDTIGNYSK